VRGAREGEQPASRAPSEQQPRAREEQPRAASSFGVPRAAAACRARAGRKSRAGPGKGSSRPAARPASSSREQARSSRVQDARREEQPRAGRAGRKSRAHRKKGERIAARTGTAASRAHRRTRANLQAGTKIQRQKNPRLGVAQGEKGVAQTPTTPRRTPTAPRRTPYSTFPGRRGRLATFDAWTPRRRLLNNDRGDSNDYVFMLILVGFHQRDFHKNRLKSWVFGSLQQLLVARS
jgi:hypothetical protein